MKNSIKEIAAILIIVFSGFTLSSQNQQNKVIGKVKMIKVEDENGDVSKSYEEFNFDDQEELDQFLKSKGIKDKLIEFSDGEHKDLKGRMIKLQKGDEDDSTAKTKMIIMHLDESTDFDFRFDINEERDHHFEWNYTGPDSLKGNFLIEELIEDDSIKVRVMRKAHGDTTRDQKSNQNAFVIIHRKKYDKELDDDLDSLIRGHALRFQEVQDMPIEDLSIYPNPTKGTFTTEFHVTEPSNVVISVIDTKGAQIFSKELPNFEGRYKDQVDLNDVESGIYFYNLQIGDERETHKIIVQ